MFGVSKESKALLNAAGVGGVSIRRKCLEVSHEVASEVLLS